MSLVSFEKLSRLLEVEPEMLESLEKEMARRSGRKNVLGKVADENDARVAETLRRLNLDPSSPEEIVRRALFKKIIEHEKQILYAIDAAEGRINLEKAAAFARQIARVGRGFFLKKAFAEKILTAREPENLLRFLGYKNVHEIFERHDVTEAFSALRFTESDQWMHETFESAYSNFSPEDFEEREIEIRVLGPEWKEMAKKFVEKKHHNVSHLKEFGVIFINPISEDLPGKFLRDFALLLHYFHEIEFYSKLFRRYASGPAFAVYLKSLLRGDVKDIKSTGPGDWLIVQRYLFKENPKDHRLTLPRVNPESLHWARGEMDLAAFGAEREDLDLEFWQNLDWVAAYFDNNEPLSNLSLGRDSEHNRNAALKRGNGRIVSFDLEDNVMSAVSAMEGKKEFFFYHQREALWTKIFKEYAGGEEEMEKLLLAHFTEGFIHFGSR